MQPVSKQRIGKHALLETVFSIRSAKSGYKEADGLVIHVSHAALPLVTSKFRHNIADPMLVKISP
jgi:hypothetical protein